MLLEVLPALFHFDEHDGFPDIIGEGRAPAVFVGFADAEFGRAARVETAGLAEGLKEPVEKDLRLPLFVARDVFLTPGGECSEFIGIRHAPFVTQSVCRVSNLRRAGPQTARAESRLQQLHAEIAQSQDRLARLRAAQFIPKGQPIKTQGRTFIELEETE